MAELRTEGSDLVLHLRPLEQLGALHRSFRVPRAAVRSARVSVDPWEELRGVRLPGTGLPRVIMLGTLRGPFGRDFCALRGERPALVLELEGERYARVMVTVEDPEGTLTRLDLNPAARWAYPGSA